MLQTIKGMIQNEEFLVVMRNIEKVKEVDRKMALKDIEGECKYREIAMIDICENEDPYTMEEQGYDSKDRSHVDDGHGQYMRTTLAAMKEDDETKL